MTAPEHPRPIVLVIIDGFGLGTEPASDAIAAARMPVWHGLLERWPHARLDASADAVGLPAGQMGNSEVGHLNIGAGRPVLQDLPRIDAAIADGSFFTRPAFVEACRLARAGRGRLNVVGLVGPGGVHAHDRHIVALAELARREGVPSFRLHALLDGRDTPPRSALGFVAALEGELAAAHPHARIASIGGRYFAMDRDKRWERAEAGYDAIVHGVGEHAASATAAIEAGYDRGENDEFVTPTVIDGVDGGLVDGEPIIHANFRADRARQLVHALADRDFTSFDRAAPDGRRAPHDLAIVTMTEYEADLPVLVAFPPEVVPCLAGAAAEAGWRQLHVAETEKYAHVTYFLNGGREEPFDGEERVLVPSPKVATYDLRPEMSADGVTDALVAGIASGRFDLLVANFANPDMVGHTGHWDATVRAVEAVDACLRRIVTALAPLESSGALLAVTADHGNADAMRTADGGVVTAHSLNPVPFLLAGRAVDGRELENGALSDIAPTLITLAGLRPWHGMTGRSLLAIIPRSPRRSPQP
ncbi:MAG: 2,3-bisphosphoglycerate-independent phosphoglycerate mutase [Chloroflexi bacterium]|nr:2,3-bisphosphoglycerate-independent phosphoglycerate mutase [Chloroflexota bacterium]